MKTHPSRRKGGFTLVELLVVIAIIAVLAGTGFAVGLSAIQKAKKTTALNTCTALVNSINLFYSEYNSPPIASTTTDPTYRTSSVDTQGVGVLKVLLGKEDATSTPLNPKNSKFLEVGEGKTNRNGLIYNTTGTSIIGLYDPWGGPYRIIIDGDYDESVSPQQTSGSSIKLNGRKAAAWSEGADGAKGSGGKIADDVKTW